MTADYHSCVSLALRAGTTSRRCLAPDPSARAVARLSLRGMRARGNTDRDTSYALLRLGTNPSGFDGTTSRSRPAYAAPPPDDVLLDLTLPCRSRQ